MNQTEFPSLAANDAVAGFVFQQQEAGETKKVDRKTLEVSCVDLICKLENLLAKAKEMPKDDFIDESAIVGRKMLEHLSAFGDKFFVGNAAEQAKEEIGRAMTYSHLFDEVLKTRSLTNIVIRTFWNVKESDEILSSHAQLGEALIRGCAATLYHAIMLLGVHTDLGKEIDQSTIVFVTELKQSWN